MPSSLAALIRSANPASPGAFRLLLAMLVFVHHFSRLALGTFAVMVFFVLSGFWLHRMWENKYRHTRSAYFTYMVSRMWRLAPVMALTSLMMIGMYELFGIYTIETEAQNPVWLGFSSVFLLGYAWLPFMPVGPAWSLDIEMRFYLVAPLIAVALARFGKGAVLAAALLATAISLWLTATTLLAHYIVFFVVGMIASSADWRPSQNLAIGSGLAVIAAVVITGLSPFSDLLLGGAHRGALFVYNPHYSAALALLALPWAIGTVHRPSDATDRMLADLSFIVYLQHAIALQVFKLIDGPFLERLAVAAASFTLVPIVSWLIWRYFDRPISRRRDAWVKQRLPLKPLQPS